MLVINQMEDVDLMLNICFVWKTISLRERRWRDVKEYCCNFENLFTHKNKMETDAMVNNFINLLDCMNLYFTF